MAGRKKDEDGGAYEGMTDEEIEAEENERTSDVALSEQYDRDTNSTDWRKNQ